jgi:hypothetical protein
MKINISDLRGKDANGNITEYARDKNSQVVMRISRQKPSQPKSIFAKINSKQTKKTQMDSKMGRISDRVRIKINFKI